MENKFKVKIPAGWLMVEAKGAEDEYPGVFISLSQDGKEYDVNNMVACVEYDTGGDECLKIESYMDGQDEPTHIISYDSGKDLY